MKIKQELKLFEAFHCLTHVYLWMSVRGLSAALISICCEQAVTVIGRCAESQ